MRFSQKLNNFIKFMIVNFPCDWFCLIIYPDIPWLLHHLFVLITNDIQSKIGIRWHQKFMFESLNQSILTCNMPSFP